METRSRERESPAPLLEQSLPFVSSSRSESTRHGRRYTRTYTVFQSIISMTLCTQRNDNARYWYIGIIHVQKQKCEAKSCAIITIILLVL